MPEVGRKAEGKHTQSVIFEKEAGWDKGSSKKWLKDNDYKTDGLDESDTQLRWRQYDPDTEKFRYRTQVIEEKDGKPSIMLVLGFPINSSKGSAELMELRMAGIMPDQEERSFDIELRVEMQDGNPKIEGVAAVYNNWSEDLGYFREMIEPGFFDDVLKGDTRALWNHNADMVLGRTKAGTLKLEDTERGLGISIDPPDTQAGRDAMVSIKRRDVTQMSFAFQIKPGGDEWIREKDGKIKRVLKRGGAARLFDVSPVTYPAYPKTSVYVRSMIEDLSNANSLELTGEGETPEPDNEHARRLVRSKHERRKFDIQNLKYGKGDKR